MVQVFDLTPTQSTASMIGNALGMGVAKNLPQPEQMVQRGLLRDAFSKINPNMDMSQNLQNIAPELLTTAGGVEALNTILPMMQKQAQTQAYKQYIDNQRKGISQQRQLPQQSQIPQDQNNELLQQIQPRQQKPGQIPDVRSTLYQDYIIQKQEEAQTYPEITAGPEITRLLSPDERRKAAYDLMEQSNLAGNPISLEQSMNIVDREQQSIAANNEQIRIEQQRRKSEIKDITSGYVKRAINAGLINPDRPEDITVAEELAMENRKNANPSEAWKNIRKGLREWKSAKNTIQREFGIKGPFSELYNKAIGNYKDVETVINNLQNDLDKYRKYGLIDEARKDISTYLGFGPELTERAIFPFTKEQSSELDKFPGNIIPRKERAPTIHDVFPGELYNLDANKFDKFKDYLENYLGKNKDINLISLRGVLNQNKKYSWQDISKAIGELIEEDRFTPNYTQDQQLKVINQAPLPGLMEQFKFLWTGKK